MKNLEAADLLDNLIEMVSDNHDSDYDEALSKGRDILKSELCEDVISRQAAIDLANELKDDLPDDDHLSDMVMSHNEGVLEYQTKLSLLPPVTPQPKTGHWTQISPQGIYECSECGQNVMTSDICVYKFCHGCGAKMVEPQESEG